MDILNKIVAHKKEEIVLRKRLFPVNDLQKSALFERSIPSFYSALNKPEPSIIAEYKRKSPSKGIINDCAGVEEVARAYQQAGVSAMSILTDELFFGGDNTDLSSVAGFSSLPLLRKDFIIDEYQVIEAKSIGASAILLIGSILNKKEAGKLTNLALTLGIDVLFEIHNKADIEKINHNIRIVGVNNRNLNTFEINMENSLEMLRYLPQNCIKIAESGVQSISDVKEMYSRGFDAFLIGEKFMRSADPGACAEDFISGLKMIIS